MDRQRDRPAGDGAALRGWSIGILGYGNQGRAQALNLRDAGLDVVIGARAGGESDRRARQDRFTVLEPIGLWDACGLVALLTPDETHRSILENTPPAGRTRALVVAHGYSLLYDGPALSDQWDVLLIAPSGPGTALRRDDAPGRIPALMAVHQDKSGSAWSLAVEYAIAAGCKEDALIRTTVREEVEIDLFGEQAVLCGGLAALVTAAWETLVARGYDPKIAYIECVHQIGLTADLITRYGVGGMRERISRLALFGDLTRGPRVIDAKVRKEMADILDEIRNGRFAAEWSDEVRSDCPRTREGLASSRRHPLEEAGSHLRKIAFGPDSEPLREKQS